LEKINENRQTFNQANQVTKKTQITKIKDEKDITTDPTEI
jgi:hypothetical protein